MHIISFPLQSYILLFIPFPVWKTYWKTIFLGQSYLYLIFLYSEELQYPANPLCGLTLAQLLILKLFSTKNLKLCRVSFCRLAFNCPVIVIVTVITDAVLMVPCKKLKHEICINKFVFLIKQKSSQSFLQFMIICSWKDFGKFLWMDYRAESKTNNFYLFELKVFYGIIMSQQFILHW